MSIEVKDRVRVTVGVEVGIDATVNVGATRGRDGASEGLKEWPTKRLVMP